MPESDKTDKLHREIASFVNEHVAPHAADWDRTRSLPDKLRSTLASRGYLASSLPETSGGAGCSMESYGVLFEQIGRACTSVRSILTAHDMAAHAIARWGDESQRQTWLGRLTSGETVAAFALSEPGVGSDIKSIETVLEKQSDGWLLTGAKTWITNAVNADLNPVT